MLADGVLKRTEASTNLFNSSRQRVDGGVFWIYEFDREVAALFRFSGSLKHIDVIENDLRRADLDSPVAYDFVVHNRRTSEFRILHRTPTLLSFIKRAVA